MYWPFMSDIKIRLSLSTNALLSRTQMQRDTHRYRLVHVWVKKSYQCLWEVDYYQRGKTTNPTGILRESVCVYVSMCLCLCTCLCVCVCLAIELLAYKCIDISEGIILVVGIGWIGSILRWRWAGIEGLRLDFRMPLNVTKFRLHGYVAGASLAQLTNELLEIGPLGVDQLDILFAKLFIVYDPFDLLFGFAIAITIIAAGKVHHVGKLSGRGYRGVQTTTDQYRYEYECEYSSG